MRKFFILLISAFFLTLASCGENKYRMYSGAVWGTMFHITYESPSDLNDSILEEMGRVDRSLSMFNPTSLVSAVNSGKSLRADSYFTEVLATSQEVSALSGGAFDPTVGPLVELWGFGPGGVPATEPSDSAIDAALRLVGISDCHIGVDGLLTKKHPLTHFDFSAIAKGYGVERVARVLMRNGVENFMVEIGGEVVLRGLNPRGRAWHIQIEAPVADADERRGLTVRPFGPELTSIASSGNYRNYRTGPDGRRIGHTISPSTGRPFQGDVLASTVILRGSDCGRADALATAAMALPSAQAVEMLRKAGAQALIVTGSPDNYKVLTVNTTSNHQTGL